jgi:hypothetical protein
MAVVYRGGRDGTKSYWEAASEAVGAVQDLIRCTTAAWCAPWLIAVNARLASVCSCVHSALQAAEYFIAKDSVFCHL